VLSSPALAAVAAALDEQSRGLDQRLAFLTAAAPGWPLSRLLPVLAAVGIVQVELAAGPETELPDARSTTIARTLTQLEAAEMKPCGVAASGAWPLGSHELMTAVSAAAALGASFVRAYAPPYEPGRSARVQLDEVVRALADVRARSAEANVSVLVETAQETLVPSVELARYVVDKAGREHLGVVYDPGNMIVEGHLSPGYAISLLDDLLCHVHAKNQRAQQRQGQWSYLKTAFDRGQVDWTEVAEALTGYDGLVSVDHLSGPPTRRRLEADVATLRRSISPAAIAARTG
jgi:sugar phosphate isomerase/epimerase